MTDLTRRDQLDWLLDAAGPWELWQAAGLWFGLSPASRAGADWRGARRRLLQRWRRRAALGAASVALGGVLLLLLALRPDPDPGLMALSLLEGRGHSEERAPAIQFVRFEMGGGPLPGAQGGAQGRPAPASAPEGEEDMEPLPAVQPSPRAAELPPQEREPLPEAGAELEPPAAEEAERLAPALPAPPEEAPPMPRGPRKPGRTLDAQLADVLAQMPGGPLALLPPQSPALELPEGEGDEQHLERRPTPQGQGMLGGGVVQISWQGGAAEMGSGGHSAGWAASAPGLRANGAVSGGGQTSVALRDRAPLIFRRLELSSPEEEQGQPIWVAETETTQAQWQVLQGEDLKSLTGFWQQPAEVLSWCEALTAANALSAVEGLEPVYSFEGDCARGGRVRWDRRANGFRLLTEDEWEQLASASDVASQMVSTESNSRGVGVVYNGTSATAQGLMGLGNNAAEWVWGRGPEGRRHEEHQQGELRAVARACVSSGEQLCRLASDGDDAWPGVGFRLARSAEEPRGWWSWRR